MTLHPWAVAIIVIGGQTVADDRLLGDDTTDTVKDLKQQIEQLDQKGRILERNRELEKEAAASKTNDIPRISIGGKGVSFGSSDGAFAINLKGVIQFDSRTFFKDGGIKGNDGFLLRRARPLISSTIFFDFFFLFLLAFGGRSVLIFCISLVHPFKPPLQL